MRGERTGGGPSASPAEESPNELTQEQANEIISEKLKLKGRGVMTLNVINKTDRHNALTEAVEQRVQQDLGKNKALRIFTKAPIVGQVVKAAMASWHRSKASKGIRETGTLEGAFDALGLDASTSKAVNLENESAASDRAWQALENAGYSEDNKIDYAESKLSQDEKVERMTEEELGVKDAFNDYYRALKSAESDEAKEKAQKDFDSRIGDLLGQKKKESAVAETLIGDHN